MRLFAPKPKPEVRSRQPQLMAGQGEYLFRRSRTLVGSASSDVRAAAETPSAHLQSSRLKAHHLRRHRRGIAASLMVSLGIVFTLAWLLGQYVQIPADVRYSQAIARTPQPQAYLSAMQDYFAMRPTERFLFNLDQAALTAYVNSKHPEVGEVTVGKGGVLPEYEVEVRLREPVAVWRAGGREVFVDREGEVFFQNYFDSPGVTVEDQSGIDPESVGTLASNRFISFMGQLVDAINAEGVGPVETVIIPKGTARQIDIKLKGQPYIIKTHIDRQPAVQAADVAAAVRHVITKGIRPEYLDVRVAGRAFYR